MDVNGGGYIKHHSFLLFSGSTGVRGSLFSLQDYYILHLVIYQTLLPRVTYSKYRDILPEESRGKCLAQGHNVINAGPGIKPATF